MRQPKQLSFQGLLPVHAQNLGLAVRAFRELLDLQEASVVNGSAGPDCSLVLAGGCDARLAENKEHYAELQALVQALGLQEQARSTADRFSWLLVCFGDGILHKDCCFAALEQGLRTPGFFSSTRRQWHITLCWAQRCAAPSTEAPGRLLCGLDLHLWQQAPSILI